MSDTRERKVLVVDDERPIRRMLDVTLTAQEYRVIEAATAAEALHMAATEHPDIILLDLGLPDMDGRDVISRIREWSQVPIIILSARDRDHDKAEALDRGADDYVTKPFSALELLARMRTALRHRVQSETPTPVFTTGGLTVDLLQRTVTVDGNEVKLTPKEYDILRVLVTHAGKVVTHRHLLREVWGPTYLGQTHYVRVFVGTLRQKIEPDAARPRYILTESGIGYRFRDVS